MDAIASTAGIRSAPSIMASSMSLVEAPIDDENINDESTDSELERKNETNLRLQSIYNRQSLTESRDEFFPSIDVSKFNTCVACEKHITDLVIWALNKPYHCKCLVCFVCREPIGFRKFKVVEGKMLMCYKDYYESYQKCRICQRRFEGKENHLSFKKLYHNDCYKCVNCYDPLTADSAVELFDETYCCTCAEDIVSKKSHLLSYYEDMGRIFRHLRSPNPGGQ
uniref:Zyxin n=1 Tax=Lygus hesperus TaxID=30085 RepID=A0A0A9XI12_LYGHE